MVSLLRGEGLSQGGLGGSPPDDSKALTSTDANPSAAYPQAPLVAEVTIIRNVGDEVDCHVLQTCTPMLGNAYASHVTPSQSSRTKWSHRCDLHDLEAELNFLHKYPALPSSTGNFLELPCLQVILHTP